MGIIDDQSAKCAKSGGRIDASGSDAVQKIKSKNRHILIDTVGLLMGDVIHPTNSQDRDGGGRVLVALFDRYLLLQKPFADGRHRGRGSAMEQNRSGKD